MSDNDRGLMTTIGSYLHTLNKFLFERHKKPTAVFGTILIIMLTIFVFRSEAEAKRAVILGRDDIRALEEGRDGDFFDIEGLSGFVEYEETLTATGKLGEGSTYPIDIETEDRVITSIKIELNWEDEPDIRRIRLYENQPDEFTVIIKDPEGGTKEGNGKNTQGGAGSIVVFREYSKEEVEGQMEMKGHKVEITLTNSGDLEARFGLGLLIIEDGSNEFSYTLTTKYLGPPQEE